MYHETKHTVLSPIYLNRNQELMGIVYVETGTVVISLIVRTEQTHCLFHSFFKLQLTVLFQTLLFFVKIYNTVISCLKLTRFSNIQLLCPFKVPNIMASKKLTNSYLCCFLKNQLHKTFHQKLTQYKIRILKCMLFIF